MLGLIALTVVLSSKLIALYATFSILLGTACYLCLAELSCLGYLEKKNHWKVAKR